MANSEKIQKTCSYEITFRAIGQALEALGIESFELVLEGDTFVLYGGPESTPQGEKASAKFKLYPFGRKRNNKSRRGIYISGVRFRDLDVNRLDQKGRDVRISGDRCPDANSLSHGLRMIGAHCDQLGVSLLGVARDKGLFTVWHKSRSGGELKQVFTQANLYDLWVHLYKKRKDVGSKPTGTTRDGF